MILEDSQLLILNLIHFQFQVHPLSINQLQHYNLIMQLSIILDGGNRVMELLLDFKMEQLVIQICKEDTQMLVDLFNQDILHKLEDMLILNKGMVHK